MNKTLFLVHIQDGYSLRNTICMLKNESDEITLLLTKTNIFITFCNKGEYGIHDITIDKEELSDYLYNITDRDDYPITVNTAELFNATKSIGRKDGLKIYWIEGQEKLSIRPIKLNKETGQFSDTYINIIQKEYRRCEFINDFNNDDSCIKMPNKSFSEICTQAITAKCQYLELSGSSNVIVFRGVLPDGSPGIESRFTSPSNGKKVIDVDMEGLNHIKIPFHTLKTLSKLHNISPIGTLLKFSFMTDRPMKIESKIGSYGVYKIFLRNKVNF